MKCETCGGLDREESDDLSHVLCRLEELQCKLDEETKRATGRSQGYVKLVERLAAAEKKAQDLDLANSAMHAIREACNEIMGGNCSYVDELPHFRTIDP